MSENEKVEVGMLCYSDYKESPEETLAQVKESLADFGLTVELSSTGGDGTWWTIRREGKEKAFPKILQDNDLDLDPDWAGVDPLDLE